jgi:Fe2+ transport system protein B
MIVEILFVVCMFLWFLTNLPVPQAAQFNWAGSWLAFIAVLLLGVFIFMPGIRG